MSVKPKISPSEEKLILPHFMRQVSGRREKGEGKVKIPTYNELVKVKGKFINVECPGTGFSFTCRFWKGKPITFGLMDGMEYEIPEVVADHINNNCAYKKMRWISPDGTISTGKPVMVGGRGFQGIGEDFSKEVASKTHRVMFQIKGFA